jgi:hypothetical protein
MKSLASCLAVAAVLASSVQAHALYARYAVRATCARSGIVGIGADVTVAAAAQTAIAECRAAGGSGRCCRGNVKLWRLL